jgi:hypothetical protein
MSNDTEEISEFYKLIASGTAYWFAISGFMIFFGNLGVLLPIFRHQAFRIRSEYWILGG